MKVFIDCRMLGSGGIGSYLAALLPLFVNNYDCTLLGNESEIQKYLTGENQISSDNHSHSYNIINCDIKTFSFRELLFFPKAISKKINECDIYYTPYCNIPSGIKIPVYSTIHDVVFLDIPSLSGFTGRLVRKWFYQYAVNKSKKIFTVSNFSKERIQHHLNTRPEQVIITYNALPHWFYKGVNINIQKNDYILFVGNIKKHKGLHTLLEAYRILLEKKLEAKLVIVGNSDNFRTQDNNIWNEISSFPDGSVLFTGRISDSQLEEVYAKSKLLVQPSLYEGFGMPPLEALNLDTDVILSDIPVFKEIYKDFPVTFFKCQDAQDLAEKIISGWDTFGKQSIHVPEVYSFEKTFQIIKSTIE